MQHLRVICPARSTDEVRALLSAAPGATHVTVLVGAALQPPGDLVEADVTREAVDGVLVALSELGVDHTGGVTVQRIDTTLSDSADDAQQAVPGDPLDAVVWDEVLARTGEDSRLSVAGDGGRRDGARTRVRPAGGDRRGHRAAPPGPGAARGARARRGGFPLAMAATAPATVAFDATGLLDVAVLDTLDQVDFIYQVG